MKKHRAQVYSILKSLQSKGLVEPTLASPARFTAISLETAIDLDIKAKREAAALIEAKKGDLLDYWRTISQPEQQISLEKFAVVEGNSKIYPRIAQMIKDTKNQLSLISSLQGLLQADQHDVFDAVHERTMESHFECRVITEFSADHAKVLKRLLESLPEGLNFKGRSPNLGQRLTPRMIIRDNEEILFFISSEKENVLHENDSCLWTNCKELVQSFAAVFSNLWGSSLDIEKRIREMEAGKPTTLHTIFDAQIVLKKYDEVFQSAKDEVIMMTSSEELRKLAKKSAILKGLSQKGVSIKVLAPITCENSEISKSLSRYCEIKHCPDSQLRTTLVDGQHLFQFNDRQLHLDPKQETPFLNTAIYTNDYEQAQNIRIMLHSLWKNAQAPSAVLKTFSASTSETVVSSLWDMLGQSPQRKSLLQIRERKVGELTEKELLDKMIHAKKLPAKDPMKDMNIQYGSKAIAVIHSPNEFKLPDMTISFHHDNKQSSFCEDSLTISLWLKTPKGYAFVPVALVTDNPKAAEWRKGVYAGTSAGKNSILIRKNQLKITVQGNTLFAGWTIPIPLVPPKYVLPPASILFEGHGELKTAVIRTSLPSGRTQVNECNRSEAFFTFFHPALTYQGPGTDGVFYREYVMTAFPPGSEKL